MIKVGKLDDVLHEVDHVLAFVIEEHFGGLIDERVVHECAIDGPEMVLKGPGKRQSDIDHAVTSQTQKVMFEVFVKDFLGLIHDFFTHQNEKLAALVARFLPRAEIVLHDFDDCFLLVAVFGELIQNGGQCGGCCTGHSGDSVLAEFEEHGQELRVHDSSVKQGCVFAQILGKHLLGAPVIARLIEGLSDVLDVPRTLGFWHFCEQHV